MITWELLHTNYKDSIQFTRNHLKLLYLLGGFYLIGIIQLQRYMKHRESYKLKYTLFLWNLLLSIYSIYSTTQVISFLLSNLYNKGITYSVCTNQNRKQMELHPIIFFFCIYSKILEWGDTILLLLNKKNLSFLHYFHHYITFIYCVDSWSSQPTSGYIFCSMNVFVHSIMYFYYALNSIGIYLSHTFKICLTSLQIGQMILGLSSLIIQKNNCPQDSFTENFGISMYLFYFYLFISFFINKYFIKRKKD